MWVDNNFHLMAMEMATKQILREMGSSAASNHLDSQCVNLVAWKITFSIGLDQLC